MNQDVFRVTIRGKFDGLTDEQRASLAGRGGQLMFSEEGTFTHDANVTVSPSAARSRRGPMTTTARRRGARSPRWTPTACRTGT